MRILCCQSSWSKTNDRTENDDYAKPVKLSLGHEGRMHANLQYMTKILGKFGFQ